MWSTLCNRSHEALRSRAGVIAAVALTNVSINSFRPKGSKSSSAAVRPLGCIVVNEPSFSGSRAAKGHASPLPPRPIHIVLRPDVDPRVDSSMLIRFDPPEHLRTGAAVLICPGGNYEKCCTTKEGQQVAVWLNSLGITAIVLRYRLIPEGHYWPAQLEDYELAMKILRAHAKAWHINTKRIGVLGFSAGGHLAGMGANSKLPEMRPDAQILIYPTIDVTKPEWWPWRVEEGFAPPEDSVHLHVHSTTPPAFLAVSSEDGLCTAEENTRPYANQLRMAGVPVEEFESAMGAHGHGLKGGWTTVCEAWLAQIGWIPARTKTQT